MAYRNVVINGEVKRVPVDGATGRPTWGARAAAPEAEDQIAADPKLSKMTLGEMATSFFKALLTPRNIVILLVWLLVLKLAGEWWQLLFILTPVALMLWNTKKRREAGEASGYSIFNGFRQMPGQLTQGEIDSQMRHERPSARRAREALDTGRDEQFESDMQKAVQASMDDTAGRRLGGDDAAAAGAGGSSLAAEAAAARRRRTGK